MHVRPQLQDDPSIPDTELVYRGVHPNNFKEDNTVVSVAFRSGADPNISVDLSSLSTPEQTLRRRPTDAGVIQLITRTVRQITRGIARDPVKGNCAHALIIHDDPLTNAQRKAVEHELAKGCVWAIPPRIPRIPGTPY